MNIDTLNAYGVLGLVPGTRPSEGRRTKAIAVLCSWDALWAFATFLARFQKSLVASSVRCARVLCLTHCLVKASAVFLTVRPLPRRTRLVCLTHEQTSLLGCSLGRACFSSSSFWPLLSAVRHSLGAPIFMEKFIFFLSRPQIGRDYPLNLSI